MTFRILIYSERIVPLNRTGFRSSTKRAEESSGRVEPGKGNADGIPVRSRFLFRWADYSRNAFQAGRMADR